MSSRANFAALSFGQVRATFAVCSLRVSRVHRRIIREGLVPFRGISQLRIRIAVQLALSASIRRRDASRQRRITSRNNTPTRQNQSR